MIKFLMAMVVVMASVSVAEAGPFRRGFTQGGCAQGGCANGVCALPLHSHSPTPAVRVEVAVESHAAHAGHVRSVLVAPARGVAAVGKGAAKVAGKGVKAVGRAGKAVVKGVKRGGGKVVAVGRKILPPYGR